MIILKSAEEIEKIARSGHLVAELLRELATRVKAGVTTRELDAFVEKQIRKKGGVPAFRGYRGFPASLCVSVNEEVVHGIPSGRVLREGDLVGLDLGVVMDGFYGDAAVTVPIGNVAPSALRLLDVTRTALDLGIQQAVPGGRLSNISHAVQTYAEGAGYSVVTDFVGHGIGRSLHEEPQVPNFGPPGQGVRLRPGMVLAIEPMINMGKADVVILDDKWTAVTADGSLSAHFEHTVAITEKGPRILTQVT